MRGRQESLATLFLEGSCVVRTVRLDHLRATLLAVAAAGLTLTVVATGQPPVPAPAQPLQPAQPAAPANPWANKFFLPDIGTNREQTAPAVITHNFGEVPHGTLCVHKFPITNIYDTPMEIT